MTSSQRAAGPRSHPIAVPADMLAYGVTGNGGSVIAGVAGGAINGVTGTGGVGVAAAGVRPATYQPTQYMTPIKVDPAALSSIGPVTSEPVTATVTAARTSDPGRFTSDSQPDFSFPSVSSQTMTTTSISAAGAPSHSLSQPPSHTSYTTDAGMTGSMTGYGTAAPGLCNTAVGGMGGYTASSRAQIPADPAAQTRLLNLLGHRLGSAPSEETLLQLIEAAEKV